MLGLYVNEKLVFYTNDLFQNQLDREFLIRIEELSWKYFSDLMLYVVEKDFLLVEEEILIERKVFHLMMKGFQKMTKNLIKVFLHFLV
jgi:hypothetical protein